MNKSQEFRDVIVRVPVPQSDVSADAKDYDFDIYGTWYVKSWGDIAEIIKTYPRDRSRFVVTESQGVER